MGNRIADLIGRYETRIAKLNGVGLDGRPVDRVHDEMKLSLDEFVQYQNLQAQAHAQGILTPAEAQTVYLALGGEGFNPDWPTGTSLGTKVAITHLMGELLNLKLHARMEGC